MKIKSIIIFCFLIVCRETFAQDIYHVVSSKISFFAGTAVEDIDAANVKATSFVNLQTGEVIITIPNKEFRFKRALMEEHFNENYIESEKYPKSEFKGKINDVEKLELKSVTSVEVMVTGLLTIHGISKVRTIPVTLSKTSSGFEARTEFIVMLDDHKIDRPKILWEKLAENVKVTADLFYEPYKKDL